MDDQSHYIIGYGSLITKESRFNTGQTGKCMPVTIKNYCRSWTARINNKGKRYTAVSIHHSPGSIINAVITEIKSSELSNYDRREINYSRVLIPASNIKKYNTNCYTVILTSVGREQIESSIISKEDANNCESPLSICLGQANFFCAKIFQHS